MKKNVIIASAISILYMFLLILVFRPVFTIIDDGAIQEILSGTYTGTPDAHTVYIKYILGFIISGLYSILPAVPWYSFFLIFCETVCIFVVLFRIFSRVEKTSGKFIFSGLFLLAFTACTLKGFIFFTYTSVAGLLGAAAIFWFLTINDEGTKKRQTLNYLIAVLLFLTGFSLRSNAVIMLVPILLIAVLYRFRLKKIGIYVLTFGTLLIGLVIIMAVELLAYSSPEWKYYKEFNEARTAVYETGGTLSYEDNQEAFEENGINPQLHEMYKNYYFNFDKGVVKYALSNLAAIEKNNNITIMGITKKLFSFFSGTETYVVSTTFSFLFMMALILFIINKRKKEAIFMILLFIGILMPWIYMAMVKKIVFRVGISTFYAGILFITGLLLNNKKIMSKITSIIFGVVFLIGLIFQIKGTLDYYSNGKYLISSKERTEIEEFCAKKPENIYFITNNMYVDFGFPMIEKSTAIKNCTILGPGWLSHSPITDEKLANFGVYDIDTDLLEKENTYVITYKDNDMKVLTDYLKTENFELVYEYRDTIITSSGEYHVWKLLNSSSYTP